MMRVVDIQEQLKLLVRKEARFWNVQQAVMQVIMRQKSPIIMMMNMRVGKSMLFMLLASCLMGLTVVVVPLVLLRGDMKNRCDRMGIECMK